MPAQKPRLSVFLSYASEDKVAVLEIYARLKRRGFQPWMDEKNLLPGHNWERETSRAVRSSDALVACLSNRSVTKEGFIQQEMNFALELASRMPSGQIFIIPVLLEACTIPESLRSLHSVLLSDESGYERLLRALKGTTASLGGEGSRRHGLARLLPVYGVELGITTTAEFFSLGGYTVSIGTSQLYYMNGYTFTHSSNIVTGLYLTGISPFPSEWWRLGFDWSKSFNDWSKLLGALGCSVHVTKEPSVIQFQDHDSFSAKLTAVSEGSPTLQIDFDFNYSQYTGVQDRSTLYGLKLSAILPKR